MKNLCAHLGSLSAAFFISALLLPCAPAATIRASLRPADARTKAPNFMLLNASGQAVRLSDYRGKVVLLNFWATNCGGCRLELPFFVSLDAAYQSRGLAVIGVSMDISYEGLQNAQQAWNKVKPFVEEHGIQYTILMADDTVTKAYRVEALPMTYLIDSSGRIAAIYVGVVNRENVEANIKLLMAGR